MATPQEWKARFGDAPLPAHLRPKWDPATRTMIGPDGRVVGRAGPPQHGPASRRSAPAPVPLPKAAAPPPARTEAERQRDRLLASYLRWPEGPPDGQVLYRRANPVNAGPERTRAAASALAFASDDLGLGPLTIRWVAPLSDFDRRYAQEHYLEHDALPFELSVGQDVLGWVEPSEPSVVRLRTDAPLEQIGEVVLHEARHIWQCANDWTDLPMSALQRDADEYAARVLAGVA